MVKTENKLKNQSKLKLITLVLSVFALSLVFVVAFNINDLMFINLEGSDADGYISILSVRSGEKNLDNVRVKFDVKNLYNDDDEIFEAWLVDLDSGYKLSIGSFVTNENGRESFIFRQKIVNFKIYDMIVVSVEDVNDFNPNPHTPILYAEIPESDRRIVRFKTNITGDQEVPSVNSSALGSGEFVMNKTENSLRYSINYQGLMNNETMAHIHGFADKGVNSGVLFDLPLGENKAGVFNYSELQEDKIFEGLTYVNIHSEEYPTGEIRGQIIRISDDFDSMFNITIDKPINITGNISSGLA